MIGNPPYKEKKGHVANACVHCRMKKHGCDGGTPCRRCAFEGVACMSSIRIDRRITVLKTRDIIKQVQKLHNDARICTQLPVDTIEDGWTEEKLLTLTAANREALNEHIKKLEEEMVQILTNWKRQKAYEAASSHKTPVAYTADVATLRNSETTLSDLPFKLVDYHSEDCNISQFGSQTIGAPNLFSCDTISNTNKSPSSLSTHALDCTDRPNYSPPESEPCTLFDQ